MKAEDLKIIVKDKYSQIANQSKTQHIVSCCGTSGCGTTDCCSTDESVLLTEDYEKLAGYNPDADLKLGCGIPTKYAGISKGDSVLDLGSGAGNDCFVARAIVGETGKVTGLDFTNAMLEKARENTRKLGFTNIEFVKGDIEEMPLPDNTYNVVLSNCVLNLVPDKTRAFSQIMRVLKPGGHFSVSDIVIKGTMPEKLREDAELYAGCVSGAIGMDKYIEIIEQQGFKNITVHQMIKTSLPADLLLNYLTEEESERFQSGDSGIYSITLSGYKN